MFFDREKIKKERFLFWFSVWGVSIGLVLWGSLLNMFCQSTTVTAEVVDEYVSGSSVNKHPYGSKIDIEWMDEDGDIHSEGNLSNPKGLTVGDTLQIQVDAATQSERILDGPGKLFLFIAGAVFVGLYSYPLLSFRKGKDIEPKPIKRAGPVGRVLIFLLFWFFLFQGFFFMVLPVVESNLMAAIVGGVIALIAEIAFFSVCEMQPRPDKKAKNKDSES